ncbi:MAG TPA: hypothetical protein VH969_02050 [Actinophytocola sp.]|uniref:hypothetical protein n=1 Tax=Actinophytocola sp. TaxID=1872138 RepID=UPI002F921A6A
MDSHWVLSTLLFSAGAAALLLMLMWPTRYSGKRLLQRWGSAEPTAQQIAEAVRYLRQRRILYVVLFAIVPAVVAVIWPPPNGANPPGSNILVPLIAAMLIAELIAVLRPVRGVRVASLDRRGWRDLVPTWAVVVTAVLTAWAVTLVVMGLAAQPWADRYAAGYPPPSKSDLEAGEIDPRADLVHPTGWLTLGGVVVCLVVLGVLVFLAVRRPSGADAEVDRALRTRTARVAIGIGFILLAGLVNDGQRRLVFLQGVSDAYRAPARPGWLTEGLHQTVEIVGFATLVGAIVCWLWLAMPSRKSLAHVG